MIVVEKWEKFLCDSALYVIEDDYKKKSRRIINMNMLLHLKVE